MSVRLLFAYVLDCVVFLIYKPDSYALTTASLTLTLLGGVLRLQRTMLYGYTEPREKHKKLRRKKRV